MRICVWGEGGSEAEGETGRQVWLGARQNFPQLRVVPRQGLLLFENASKETFSLGWSRVSSKGPSCKVYLGTQSFSGFLCRGSWWEQPMKWGHQGFRFKSCPLIVILGTPGERGLRLQTQCLWVTLVLGSPMEDWAPVQRTTRLGVLQTQRLVGDHVPFSGNPSCRKNLFLR